MLPSVVRWARTPGGVLGLSLLFTVLFALGVNLALNAWQPDSPPGLSSRPPSADLVLFLLGTFVVWLFVILVVAVLGRLWVSAGVIAVATALVGFANSRKQAQTLEPLFPSDLTYLRHLDFMVQMVGAKVALLLATVVILVPVAAALAGRQVSRLFPRPDRRTHPRIAAGLLVARLAGLVLSVATIGYVMQFHSPGNLVKEAYDEHGAHWRHWNQGKNYVENGFVAGMLYNLAVPAMTKPPGYSEAAMQEIVERYSTVAERVNATRDPDALDDVNVVFVLSESFSDPTLSHSVRLAEDPIPFTRSLMQRTTSGKMLTRSYGGGTANVEFEALTGMSLKQFEPQLHTPYQMLVPNYPHFPSAASYLRGQGLGTRAIHSFTSALYRRAEVYPTFGFEDAVFEDEMAHTETLENSSYISDTATFDETMGALEDADEPLFVNVVTMQNHYPSAGKYANPIPAGPRDEATEGDILSDPGAMAELEQYARGLRYSDEALQRFIAVLEASDEKTVVVFYGDHLPALRPSFSSGVRPKHETPFFVYANYGHRRAEHLPTTSPIHFMNHVLETAGAPVPPYYALLGRLEQDVPAMSDALMIGPDNRPVAEGDLTPAVRRLLHDYRLVQYDLSVGERYSEAALFDPGSPGP